MLLLPCPRGVNAFQGYLQHYTIEENEGVESLILSGWRNIPVHCQMGQKASTSAVPMSFGWNGMPGILFESKHKLLVPAHIAFFRPPRVVAETHPLDEPLLQGQFSFWNVIHGF